MGNRVSALAVAVIVSVFIQGDAAAQGRVQFNFDQTSGTPTNTGTQTGLTITTEGPITLGSPGKTGYAITLDSSADTVKIANHASLNALSNFTIEGHIYYTSLNSGAYSTLAKKDYSYLLRAYNNTSTGVYQLGCAVWNPSVMYKVVPIAAPALNTWHHMACTWDGPTRTMKIYWNGALAQTFTAVGTNAATATSTTALTLGRHQTSAESLIGRMDNFALWATTRTAAEIAASATPGPPPVPTLSYPINGATGVSYWYPEMSWGASSGATSYRVQISTSDTFYPLHRDDINPTQWYYGFLGAAGTTYYWRVNATSSAGTSAWSPIWSFTTIPPPPVPTLASPADATWQTVTPTLSWNASAGAAGYNVQLATSPAFDVGVQGYGYAAPTTSMQPTLTQGTTYYWRVNAYGAAPYPTSAWSAVRSFQAVSAACSGLSNGATCNDSNLCTYGDTCSAAGTCGGTAIVCESNNCLAGGCNGTATCSETAVQQGASCDDGVSCTYADTCNATGTCVGGGTLVCTSDETTIRECDGTMACHQIPVVGAACEACNAMPSTNFDQAIRRKICYENCGASGWTGETEPPRTLVTSCVGRCGKELTLDQQGCECSDTCGYMGTCCPDAISACPAPAGQPQMIGAGTEFIQNTYQKSVYASSYRRRDRLYLATDGAAVGTGAFNNVYGLSQVRFGDIDTRGEHSTCRVSRDQTPPTTWYVEASMDRDDNDAKCAAIGMTWPKLIGGVAPITIGLPYHAEGHNRGDQYTPAGTATNSLLILTNMVGEDTDDDGNIGSSCKSNVDCEPIECRAYVDGGGNWVANANSRDDNDVWCDWQKLSWPASNPGGITRSGPYYVKAPAYDGNIDKCHCDTDYCNCRPMVADGTGVCFLTRVRIDNADNGSEFPGCELKLKNDVWHVLAHHKVGSDDGSICEAHCLSWNDSPGLRWPRQPTTAEMSVNNGTACTVDSQCSAVTPAKCVSGFCSVGTLKFWQGGASGTDRPLLFTEGFDALDRIGSISHMKKVGPLFRHLVDGTMPNGQPAGADLWFFSPRGGDDLVAAARTIARAIKYVYEAAGSGKKVFLASLSQSGLTARLALASWEEGIYDQASPIYPIAGNTTRDPPVSMFIAFAGPQRGGAIPRAMGSFLDEVNRTYDGDLAKSPIVQMVQSKPARHMLEDRMETWSKWAMEGCTHFGIPMFRNGSRELTGFEPPPTGPHNQAGYYGPLYRDGTWPKTGDFDAFFAYTDARGRRGNGFPVTVPSVAMVNAGFAPQGCANHGPGGFCRAPDPSKLHWTAPSVFTSTGAPGPGSTTLGVLHFVDIGHTAARLCDRYTWQYMTMAPADVRPGDLFEGNFEELTNDATSLPDQVRALWVKQNTSFIRIPTVSGLACPGATTELECRQQNRQNNRFMDVISRWGNGTATYSDDNKNASHGGASSLMEKKALVYWYEYAVDNADGIITSANPYQAVINALWPLTPKNSSGGLCFQTSPFIDTGVGLDDNCDGVPDGISVPPGTGYGVAGPGGTQGPLGPFCGNLVCDATEGCGTCPSDCGACTSVTCNGTAGEWSGCRGSGCSVCAELTANYPDYFRNHPDCVENTTCAGQFYTCNSACPPPTADDQGGVLIAGPAVCGDGICSSTETSGYVSSGSWCQADCKDVCGDYVCSSVENCSSCSADCGACPAGPVCGANGCEVGEDCGSCPTDCGTCTSGCEAEGYPGCSCVTDCASCCAENPY